LITRNPREERATDRAKREAERKRAETSQSQRMMLDKLSEDL
jgi:hypothetical protein